MGVMRGMGHSGAQEASQGRSGRSGPSSKVLGVLRPEFLVLMATILGRQLIEPRSYLNGSEELRWQDTNRLVGHQDEYETRFAG
jgi:hypothetical protein